MRDPVHRLLTALAWLAGLAILAGIVAPIAAGADTAPHTAARCPCGNPACRCQGAPARDPALATVGDVAALAVQLQELRDQVRTLADELAASRHQANEWAAFLEALRADVQQNRTTLNGALEWINTQPAPTDDPTARLDALARELDELQGLTFPVQTLRPDGSVFSEQTIRLGEPIRLRLVPKN